MYFHFLVSFSYSICRDQPNLTAMRLWFYLQLYRYIADPTRMGKGDIIEKSPYPTYKGIELWIDLKLNLESGIEWWTELRWNIDGWIELWIKFWCNEHREELSLNWIQTLCPNLNWVVNPKMQNRYISAMLSIVTKILKVLYPHRHLIWSVSNGLSLRDLIWYWCYFIYPNRHVSRFMHFMYVFVGVCRYVFEKRYKSVCCTLFF